MRGRTKLVVLVVLVALLAALMGYNLFVAPARRKKAVKAKAEAVDKNTLTAADTDALSDLPGSEDLGDLAAWVAAEAMRVPPVEPLGRFGRPQMQMAATPKPPPGQEDEPDKPDKPVQPQAPPEPAVKVGPPPKLDGILLVSGQRVALIAGGAYRAGQQVGDTGYRIGKITASTAQVFDIQGNERVLNLLQ